MRSADVENSEGSRSRSIFFNLGLFQFLTFLRRGVFYTFMINYLFVLMGTVTSTATLGTLNMVASAIGQNFFWGKVCDRRKLRTELIIIGESTAGIAYIIVFFIHRALIDAGNGFASGLAIIFGLSLLEFFWSMSDVGWAALLTDVTTPDVRGKIVGILNFIASLGRMIGIVFAGFLYGDGEGFKNGDIFFIVTVLLFIGMVLMTLTSRRVRTKNTAQKQSTSMEGDRHKGNATWRNERMYKWFLVSLIIIVLGAASINQIFLLFINLPEGLHAMDPEMSLILSAWTIGGMIASLTSGALADRFGRTNILLVGLSLTAITPLFYSLASSVPLMALIYGFNGVAFWTLQTVGFALAGDIIPEDRRGRLLGRYNTVIALSWGPAGILIGGPFADIQTNTFGLSKQAAFANAFYVSSILIALGTLLFVIKVARAKPEK